MNSKEALFHYCLRLGDTSLILAQRNTEWCGHGPFLEEDLALTNIALDLLGQANSILKYAAEIEGKGVGITVGVELGVALTEGVSETKTEGITLGVGTIDGSGVIAVLGSVLGEPCPSPIIIVSLGGGTSFASLPITAL